MKKVGALHISDVLSKTLRGGYSSSPTLWIKNLPRVSHIMVEMGPRPRSVRFLVDKRARVTIV